jgi:hypothetical protein
MIDNFKAVTFDLCQIDKIWNNDSLSYIYEKDYRVEDEVRNKATRGYKNLMFTKYYNRLEISGSIHYFFNDGQHNANEFDFMNCINTYQELIHLFSLEPKLFKIIGLEYGFNIKPIKEVNQILSWLRFYRKNKIIESQEYKNFYTAGTKYKSIKIYNKTQDCPKYAEPNIMRFEVKTRESQFSRKLGINTLEDLLKKETYERLAKSVLDEWNNILIFDFDIINLIEKHITEYWLDAINNKSRNTFTNRKKTYFKELPENSLFYNLQKQLDRKMMKFVDCAYSTTDKRDQIVQNRTITNSQNTQSIEKVKRCIVTGIKLDKEIAGTNYIKIKTLKYLKEYEADKYINVCNFLLSNTKPNHTKYESNIFSHIAKQVRNKVNNGKPFRNKGYRSKQYKNQYKLSF